MLVCDVQMSDKELRELIDEVEEYKEHMVKAERQMKNTTSAFLSAHATMMEVLGAAGKIKYDKTFRKRGANEIRCMFCSMTFENMGQRKKHITTAHWTMFTAHVSISHTYFSLGLFLLYYSTIASAYSYASIFVFFRYQHMLIFGTCAIVNFALYRGKNKQLMKNINI